MIDLKLFHDVTGLTWNINELIDVAKEGTADDKKELLKTLDWLIPEGTYLENAEKRAKAVGLINAVAAELGINDLSEVFVDVDGDDDVDAYDVLDTQEQDVTYTITFADWDGSVLETQTLAEGAIPSYGGETPVREGYIFTGWDPDIEVAVADATYTAQYEAERDSDMAPGMNTLPQADDTILQAESGLRDSDMVDDMNKDNSDNQDNQSVLGLLGVTNNNQDDNINANMPIEPDDNTDQVAQ